jgi:hypothetical protein
VSGRCHVTGNTSVAPGSWSWILKAAGCLSIAFRRGHYGRWRVHSAAATRSRWGDADTIAGTPVTRPGLMLRNAVIVFVSASVNVAVCVTRSGVARDWDASTISTFFGGKEMEIFSLNKEFSIQMLEKSLWT